jgi:hypothetical protein
MEQLSAKIVSDVDEYCHLICISISHIVSRGRWLEENRETNDIVLPLHYSFRRAELQFTTKTPARTVVNNAVAALELPTFLESRETDIARKKIISL